LLAKSFSTVSKRSLASYPPPWGIEGARRFPADVGPFIFSLEV
jgi:hypothetical protein